MWWCGCWEGSLECWVQQHCGSGHSVRSAGLTSVALSGPKLAVTAVLGMDRGKGMRAVPSSFPVSVTQGELKVEMRPGLVED